MHTTTALVSLGLDSFGFIELGGRIQKQYNVDVNAVKLSPDKTLAEVAAIIFKLTQKKGGGGAGEEEGAAGNEQGQAGLGADLAGDLGRSDAAKMLKYRLIQDETAAAAPSAVVAPRGRRAAGGGILLLGATGMAGAHILRYLLKQHAGRVYCVVRAGSREAAMARVKAALAGLHLWKESFAGRIVALPGDLVRPQLGLSPSDFAEATAGLSSIVHAAGARSWSIDQQSIDCNVRGLLNLVELARGCEATIHYVSSCWLDLYEAASEEDQAVLIELPYVRIKRRGEEILRFAAAQCHVACDVIRLPLLSVNRWGRFDGELVLFILMQGMYMARAAGGLRAIYPLMTADGAGKEFVRQMRSGGRGSHRLHSTGALAEWCTSRELCDLVDGVSATPIDRDATVEEMHERLCEVFSREVMETFSLFGLIAAATRAADMLKSGVGQRRARLAGGRLRKAVHRVVKGRASAIQLLRDYVMCHPEVITDSTLVQFSREALVRAGRAPPPGKGSSSAGSVSPSASTASSASLTQ